MKRAIIILPMVLIIVLSGCGKIEIKDLAIVAGVAVDIKGEQGYEVTTQTIKPGQVQKGGEGAFLVRSSTGLTIFEAVRDFIITHGKKLLWQHVEAFIIGEETAKDGIRPVIDFLSRDHEPRSRMNIMVSKGKGKEILEMKSKTGPIPAIQMSKALEAQDSLSKAPRVEFHDFVQNLLEPYQDPYLPIIQKGKKDFEIWGTAIFKGDKMVGELTPRETRGMLRVLGEVKGGLQVVQLFSDQSKKPSYVSVEIKSSKSSIKAQMKENKPKIIIEIKEIGFIGGTNQPLNLDRKKIKEIEQRYAETIKKEVEHTVEKIQKKMKSNVLNFAGAINREDKAYWQKHKEQWDEMYPLLEVEVHVKTMIPENGLIRNNV